MIDISSLVFILPEQCWGGGGSFSYDAHIGEWGVDAGSGISIPGFVFFRISSRSKV